MRVWYMRTGIYLTVSSIDRQPLSDQRAHRSALQKHVWRAEIILLSSDGVGTLEIMRQSGKFKTCVWRASASSATIRSSSTNCATSSAMPLVDPPAHAILLSVDEKSPDPGARPHPARPAHEG